MRTTGNHFQSAWHTLCICRSVAHTDTTHSFVSVRDPRGEACGDMQPHRRKKRRPRQKVFIQSFQAWIIHLKKSTDSVFSTLSPFSQLTHTSSPEWLTWAFLLVTGPDFLSRAIAGIARNSGALTHPEATLPTGVTCLAAETPMVPAAPVTST